mgnify:FL=1
MAEFTATQGRYLSYIHTYTEGFGLPPAESEIAEILGVSGPSVNQMLKTLQKKGLIRREPGKARSIEILVPIAEIPKWKGKRISRIVTRWGPAPPKKQRNPIQAGDSAATNTRQIYRFKISLRETKPLIWRRIETPDVTLEKLHELIQTSMGWTNSHLHQFKVGVDRYTDPRFLRNDGEDFGATSYKGIRISDLVSQHGENLRLTYEYDFGDSWLHDIELESQAEADPKQKYPRCIDGAQACPPEDVGGVYGFEEYVGIITNPNDEQYGEMLEWNGPFDPAAFNPERATRAMKKGLPKW